jgi:membrane protein implicated in regulation of membrane protease activity
MTIQYWWWLIALALGIVELVTGTFYLVVFAAGCAAAGVVAAFGGPVWAQFGAAAVISLVGAALVRRTRTGAPSEAAAGRNPAVLADVGERVRVESWSQDGRARIQYRGTQWNAQLAPGEVAVPGEYTIREIAGNRLILARH